MLLQSHEMITARSLIAIALFATGCGTTSSTPPPEPPVRAAVTMESIAPLRSHHLEPASDVSDEARTYLDKRMRDHGATATDLLFSVVLLDYDGTARIASRVAEGPQQTAEFSEGEALLRVEFPETFFDLEATLRADALRLVAAATERDPELIAKNYSTMLNSCVECHSLMTKRVPN